MRTVVSNFQNTATCRVAVLAITAAGVAITLTAASTVYFAEMYGLSHLSLCLLSNAVT